MELGHDADRGALHRPLREEGPTQGGTGRALRRWVRVRVSETPGGICGLRGAGA